MAISAELLGKIADFVGVFADEAGKELGQDQKQETAELLAKIAVAAARKLLNLSTPLVAGASPEALAADAVIDDVIALAESGGL